jgi:DNA-binding XRE family transcriptional regulator
MYRTCRCTRLLSAQIFTSAGRVPFAQRVTSIGIEAALRMTRLRRRLPAPAARRLIRERAGVSQAAVASAVGVARPAISRWESGKRTPRGEHLKRYVAALEQMATALVSDTSDASA